MSLNARLKIVGTGCGRSRIWDPVPKCQNWEKLVASAVVDSSKAEMYGVLTDSFALMGSVNWGLNLYLPDGSYRAPDSRQINEILQGLRGRPVKVTVEAV